MHFAGAEEILEALTRNEKESSCPSAIIFPQLNVYLESFSFEYSSSLLVNLHTSEESVEIVIELLQGGQFVPLP
ncbi:unnamed protein product [Darwinula stevensoni]|uniref:Uncharacterized protein n=1 Tax=Darwinula stevensoni TaxID=69355 RepID=A0A7R9AB75_9CRUS|nr:unnamed protein product [Darwinula stevensoni]CAG0899158.1 unnamed protein product [Darwinula stevensoni]